MSNLLKSKFLLGLMIVAILFVGVVALQPAKASAADCTITKTLKYGMRGAEVTCLQEKLSVSPATGYFGNLTKAAVKVFQTEKGLTPVDGIVGAKTRAALAGTVGGTFPAGCTSNSGFSTTTGLPCSGGVNLPAGCTSTSGFSSTTGLPCSTTTPPVTSGPLVVSLATDNPASGTIVAGQATADLAHFAFTGTGTISSVTLKRSGISDQNTLSNVYLYDGMTRLTDGYSFNNSGDLTMSGLNIAVSGSKVLSVRADVASTTSYDVAITLTSYTVTGGTANAVSVKGNSMFIASAPSTLGALAFNGGNTVTGTPTVNPGTLGYTVWSAPFQVNQHNLLFKSANFRVIGSAPADALANVKMYLDGVAIGSAGVSTVINGSTYFAFDMSAAPVTLNTGSHTLDLRADVVKGSARTVQVSIQQASDLMLFDAQVGINVAATGINSTNTTAVSIIINAGTISTSIDSTFQGMTTVTGGATNVTIAKFKLHGYGEDVKVNTLDILPVITGMGTPAVNGLQNVTVYFNGSQIGSQTANWSSGNVALTPGSQMIVPAGVDSYLEVKADLRTIASVNYVDGSVSANLVVGATGGEGMNSHNSVAIAAVTGNVLSVQTGVVAVAKNAGFANSQTVSPNTANTKIASFVIQNQSSSESVRITNLQVALALTTVGSTNYSNLKTSETSGNGAIPINPSTAAAGETSTNNFSVDFTIAPGTTKTLDVFADIGSTAGSATVITKLFVTALGSTSNVSLCSPSKIGGSINGCNSGTIFTGQTVIVAVGTFGTPVISTIGTTAGQNIAGGTTAGITNAATAQFKFTAANGSATISELKFAETGGHGAVTKVTVGSVEAPMVSGVAYLTGLSIPVPQGGAGVTVDAKMSYSAVGPTGVATTVTGDIDSLMGLSYVKYTMGGTTSTLCATGCTASTLMPVDSAQTMILVGSKPTVTVAAPTGVNITTGSVEAIDVTISADTAGPITMVSFPINVSLNGAGTGGSLTVATGAGNPVIVKDANYNTTGLSATGNFTATTGGTITVTLNSTTGYLLAGGGSQTFRVYIPIASITSGGSASWYNKITTNLVASSGFVWADTTGGGSITVTDVTGKIANYPSMQAVVVQQ
ncbi:MAG: peptidoglycan-binding domain-containing protein [bacterium]